MLNAFEKGIYYANDIEKPKNLDIINPEEILFNKISNNVHIKILIKLKCKKGCYQNPVKRANFIIEKDEFLNTFIVFDLTTNKIMSCFKALILSLKHYNFA